MGNLTKQLRVGYVCIKNFGSEFTERKKTDKNIIHGIQDVQDIQDVMQPYYHAIAQSLV